MSDYQNTTHTYILAAGQSSRFHSSQNKSKLLHLFKQKTVLQHCLDHLIQNIPSHVVIGQNHAQDIKAYMQKNNPNIQCIYNTQAHLGQKTSVIVALEHAKNNQKHALITLADMPFVYIEHYQSILSKALLNKNICFSKWQNKITAPPFCVPLNKIDTAIECLKKGETLKHLDDTNSCYFSDSFFDIDLFNINLKI